MIANTYLETSRDDLTNACTNLCVYRVYLGIHIHEIALSTDVGYHIGYLVDLASLLCLSFLFSFASERKLKYVFSDNLLSSLPTSFTTDKRSFDCRQCRSSDVRHRKENSTRTANTSCLRFKFTEDRDPQVRVAVSTFP